MQKEEFPTRRNFNIPAYQSSLTQSQEHVYDQFMDADNSRRDDLFDNNYRTIPKRHETSSLSQ